MICFCIRHVSKVKNGQTGTISSDRLSNSNAAVRERLGMILLQERNEMKRVGKWRKILADSGTKKKNINNKIVKNEKSSVIFV